MAGRGFGFVSVSNKSDINDNFLSSVVLGRSTHTETFKLLDNKHLNMYQNQCIVVIQTGGPLGHIIILVNSGIICQTGLRLQVSWDNSLALHKTKKNFQHAST